ncbi:tetratricopeptide tPR2 repeat protein [Bifidobacterium margollesii]|uniref:Tetratricopeptide tPR2 repeat protein n=1 Tax=Bifidobacterium margollesii TaxID=2020964 RepID=A0A2N5J8W0_9BIFI|nr:tetratricopeptide tPR2 repeat protein [Bifidobacterium margollesii]
MSAFDVNGFLKGLDAIFSAHDAATKAEPYLLDALSRAREAQDDGAQLTVINELLGFYRSQGRHADNLPLVKESLDLAKRMGLEGSDAWATTLINAATATRAAGRYDDAEQLYRQALESSEKTLAPTDRRLAALHNNLSILYSETNRYDEAESELREALRILESSSVNATEDVDVASTHTNLALILMNENRDDEALKHAAEALRIYRRGHLENSAHFASALAGYAQACFHAGDLANAVRAYRKSLAVIEECYGHNDYYAITKENLEGAEQAAAKAGVTVPADDGSDFWDAEGSRFADDSQTATKIAGAAQSFDWHIQPEDQAMTSSAAQAGPGANHTDSTANVGGAGTATTPTSSPATQSSPAARPDITGLALAKQYWLNCGKPMIADRYPEYQGRIAAGLVGHGSECYGFDDSISQDHDFGPRFCLWLTDDDYAAIGEQLQHDYETLLPKEFMGFTVKNADSSTPRAQGASRREGVFSVGGFFEGITGYREAPGDDPAKAHEWLLLDEATLAAATNGQIFADPLGLFSKTRQGFKSMPNDVRIALISRRLGMISQAGQYNFPRMIERGDGAAAWLSINEFVKAVSSFVFLLNEPITVGYLPYYKWQFAALRKLSRGMFTRMSDACEQLESVLRLSSAACFGGAGFGEGGKGAGPAVDAINQTIEHICDEVVKELRRDGLTRSDERFLEWQRPYVEERIANPWLKSL